ncbi:MAG: hypothetical protein V1846_02945 [Candidatus Komeilibacteria bacterium]
MTKKQYYLASICLIVIFLVFTNILYLWSALAAPSGSSYTGINLAASADKLVYYSMIEQGRLGQLLQKNIHTSELQVGSLIGPHWWLIGQTANLFSLGVIPVYHGWRILLVLVTMVVLFFWLRRLTSKYNERLWLWLFVLFAGGWGWAKALFQPSILASDFAPLTTKPVDIYMGELSLQANAQQSPLFILSHILLLLVFYLWIKQRQTISWQSESLVGALAALLIMVHPYDFWILATIPALWSLWRWWQTQDRRYLYKLSIYWFWCAASAGLVWGLVMSETALRGWSAQNLVYSPPPYNYLLAWGLLFPLAVIGTYHWWTKWRDNEWWRLLVIWTWVTWIMVYLPLDYNRRLANGWLIPVSLVAGLGALALARRIQNYYWQIIYWLFVIMAVTFGPWYSQTVYLRAMSYYQTNDRFYLSAETKELLGSLKQQPVEQIVLPFDEPIGLLIPAFTGQTIYIGHQHQTINYLQKRQKADEFFSANTGLDKIKFLVDNRISLIVVHYTTKNPAEFFSWLDEAPYLQLIKKNSTGAIYRLHQQ